jgi:hypothetical protein
MFKSCNLEGLFRGHENFNAFGQARPHISARGKEFIDEKYIRLPHSTCSPNVAPYDSHPFGMFQENLKIIVWKCLMNSNKKCIRFWETFQTLNWFQIFRHGSEDFDKFLIAVRSIYEGLVFHWFSIEQFVCLWYCEYGYFSNTLH